MDLLKKAKEAMEHGLCDCCLGRLFAQLGHGLTNEERGHSLRVYSAMYSDDDVTQEPELCGLCGELSSEYDKFAELIAESLEDLDYDTFLVGSRIDPQVEESEERLWSKLDITTSSPIKTEINREVGKRVDDLVDAEVELKVPDVKAIIDTRFDTVEVELSPLFIYGRYRKLKRGVPQTRWDCKKCRGTGCGHCDGTGKMYPTSVEEIVAEPLIDMTAGKKAVLHGMGREDIDVLMLGGGRPFVMEVSDPVSRNIDFDRITTKVAEGGDVEVLCLRRSSRDELRQIKSVQPDKTYRIYIEMAEDVDGVRFKKVIESLSGITLSQRTPRRVSHRRADKVRKREIRELQLVSTDNNKAELLMRCAAGTYVKEFVHGDGGRTEPNLSSELETECKVLELDVTDVHHEEKEVVI